MIVSGLVHAQTTVARQVWVAAYLVWRCRVGVTVDECASSPCANGGICHHGNYDSYYNCSCSLGFEGDHCETGNNN